MPRLDTAYVAGLFADRSRVAMIDVLMDSPEHAVGALARAAGIAASTATEHLSRLEDGGVVVVRRTGRQRLVRLAGPSVAAAYEALAELSHTAASSRLHRLDRTTRALSRCAGRSNLLRGAGRGLDGQTTVDASAPADPAREMELGSLGIALTDTSLVRQAATSANPSSGSRRTWRRRAGSTSHSR
jgi:DNA-binding transcriptional ArsR family regulator